MNKYSEVLTAIRRDTIAGKLEWDRRYKIANLRRGIYASIQKKAYVEQDLLTKYLNRHWPLDLWTVSCNQADDNEDGYELWVSFHGVYESKASRSQTKRQMNEAKRRARRAT